MDRQEPEMSAAVLAALREGERRQRIRRASREDASEMRRQALRNRITLDLPPQVMEHVRNLADKEGCPVSSMAAILILGGLSRYVRDRWELGWFLVESRSNRWRSVADEEKLAAEASSKEFFVFLGRP